MTGARFRPAPAAPWVLRGRRRGLQVLLAVAPAFAAAGVGAAEAGSPAEFRVESAGERLSNWMNRQPARPASSGPVHWRVPADVAAQQTTRQRVIDALGPEAAALAGWMGDLAATGRVPLPEWRPRPLEGAQPYDPLLAVGDTLTFFPAAQGVGVVGPAGPCRVSHRPGAYARDYLASCGIAGGEVAVVWIVQPDGLIERVGVRSWNAHAQSQPQAGAWLWAPSADWNGRAALGRDAARFLATQPPPDQVLAMVQPVPLSAAATAHGIAPVPRPFTLSANDWGEPGGLQTPSARFGVAGSARFQVSRAAPYTRGTVMLQPLDGFEFGFRYTDVGNRSYGAISPGQDYKDKSIDLRVRLWDETEWRPAAALGMRDIGGTGLFSAEYLVASKRWGDWDLSLGMGWGAMGTRAHGRNPLAALFGDRFEDRPDPEFEQGGTANGKTAFRGPVAFFGGVQWQSPSGRWQVKAEFDPNDYQSEPLDNNQTVRTPLNAGVVWRATPHVDLSVGLERGNTWLVAMTLHTGTQGLGGFDAPKFVDRTALQEGPAAAPCAPPCSADALAVEVRQRTGWHVAGLVPEGADLLRLVVEVDDSVFVQERMDALWMTLHAGTAPEIRYFDVQLQERGMPLVDVRLDRARWVLSRASLLPPSRQVPAQQLSAPRLVATGGSRPSTGQRMGLEWGWQPSYAQILGGPDAFILYQLGVKLSAEYRFAPSTWATGAVNARLLDNFDKYTFTGSSELPRVRTYVREYATTRRVTLPVLQLTHATALGGGHFVSGYGGWLEPMFAGVGGEWLWRPWGRRWTVGVDLNRVRQRAFEQDLRLRDYNVTTGHLNLTWETGWQGVQARVHAGQYLAGDRGATLDVRKVFRNGTSMGAWATKTNVSAEQFGEGSFDKGVYLQVPFDVMLPWAAPGMANLVWTPLTRDGGARLWRMHTLESLTWAGNRSNWTLARPGNAGPED